MTNEQNFYAGEVQHTIPLEVIEKLAKKGVLTPFDNAFKDSCVYLYIPEYIIDQKESEDTYKYIQSLVGKVNILPYKIPFSQIRKNLNKIEEKNKISIGDTVNYFPFKKLPFQVTFVKDGKCVLFHKMVYEDIVIEVSDKEVTLCEDSSEKIILTDGKIEIDSKIKDPIYIDCEDLSCLKLLQHSVCIKNLYPENSVIFFNPLGSQIELARCFNIPIMFGNILETDFHKGRVFSCNPLLEKRYEISEGCEVFYKLEPIACAYKFLEKVNKRISFKECYGTYVSIGQMLYEDKVNVVFSFLPRKKKKEKIYRSSSVDMVRARTLLKNLGADYLSEITRTIYEILKGE